MNDGAGVVDSATIASLPGGIETNLHRKVRESPSASEEPEPSRKKLFHALRVPVFALEIATKGRLGDYAAANAHLDVIRRGPLDDFAYYEEKLGPAREALVAELSRLGGKR